MPPNQLSSIFSPDSPSFNVIDFPLNLGIDGAPMDSIVFTRWPFESDDGRAELCSLCEIRNTAQSLSFLRLPDATLASKGQQVIFSNTGNTAFHVIKFSVGATPEDEITHRKKIEKVRFVRPGKAYILTLFDNLTPEGRWSCVDMGAAPSEFIPEQLAGAGLAPSGRSLEVRSEIVSVEGENGIVEITSEQNGQIVYPLGKNITLYDIKDIDLPYFSVTLCCPLDKSIRVKTASGYFIVGHRNEKKNALTLNSGDSITLNLFKKKGWLNPNIFYIQVTQHLPLYAIETKSELEPRAGRVVQLQEAESREEIPNLPAPGSLIYTGLYARITPQSNDNLLYITSILDMNVGSYIVEMKNEKGVKDSNYDFHDFPPRNGAKDNEYATYDNKRIFFSLRVKVLLYVFDEEITSPKEATQKILKTGTLLTGTIASSNSKAKIFNDPNDISKADDFISFGGFNSTTAILSYVFKLNFSDPLYFYVFAEVIDDFTGKTFTAIEDKNKIFYINTKVRGSTPAIPIKKAFSRLEIMEISTQTMEKSTL